MIFLNLKFILRTCISLRLSAKRVWDFVASEVWSAIFTGDMETFRLGGFFGGSCDCKEKWWTSYAGNRECKIKFCIIRTKNSSAIKRTSILSSTVGILTGFNPGLICKGFAGNVGLLEIGGLPCGCAESILILAPDVFDNLVTLLLPFLSSTLSISEKKFYFEHFCKIQKGYVK